MVKVHVAQRGPGQTREFTDAAEGMAE